MRGAGGTSGEALGLAIVHRRGRAGAPYSALAGVLTRLGLIASACSGRVVRGSAAVVDTMTRER